MEIRNGQDGFPAEIFADTKLKNRFFPIEF